MGRCGHGGERWAYDYIPKLDKPMYDVLRRLRADAPRQGQRLFLPGFNPVVGFPNREQDHDSAVQAQMAGRRWIRWTRRRRGSGRTHGEHNDVDTARSRPKSSSCRRPVSPRKKVRSPTPDAGCNGIGPAATPPGEAKHDNWIMGADLHAPASALSEGRRRVPGSDSQSRSGDYKDPGEPKPDELAKEVNG